MSLAFFLIGCLGAAEPSPASSASQAQEPPQVLEMRSFEWSPYIAAVGAEKPGFLIEILQRVFAKHGRRVNYQEDNWSRAIEDCRLGRIHAIVGAAPREIPGFYYDEVELAPPYVVGIATRKSAPWNYTGRESLNGKLLAVIKDYSYGELLDEYLQGDGAADVTDAEDDPLASNLRKLAEGRVDGTLDDRNVLAAAIARLSLNEQVAITGEVETGQRNVVGFSPVLSYSPTLVQWLSDGVRELRSSGELKTILESYRVQDWK